MNGYILYGFDAASVKKSEYPTLDQVLGKVKAAKHAGDKIYFMRSPNYTIPPLALLLALQENVTSTPNNVTSIPPPENVLRTEIDPYHRRFHQQLFDDTSKTHELAMKAGYHLGNVAKSLQRKVLAPYDPIVHALCARLKIHDDKVSDVYFVEMHPGESVLPAFQLAFTDDVRRLRYMSDPKLTSHMNLWSAGIRPYHLVEFAEKQIQLRELFPKQ